MVCMTNDESPRNRSIPEVRSDIIARLEKSDLSIPELCSALPEDDWVVERMMERMAAERQVCIARGTNGKRWTTTAKAKALRLAEGDDDAE